MAPRNDPTPSLPSHAAGKPLLAPIITPRNTRPTGAGPQCLSPPVTSYREPGRASALRAVLRLFHAILAAPAFYASSSLQFQPFGAAPLILSSRASAAPALCTRPRRRARARARLLAGVTKPFVSSSFSLTGSDGARRRESARAGSGAFGILEAAPSQPRSPRRH